MSRVECADRYGVAVLSGVDVPLFFQDNIADYADERFFVKQK